MSDLSSHDLRQANGRFANGNPGGPGFKALQEEIRRADDQKMAARFRARPSSDEDR